ncbi:uncharacterized protein LOC135147042 [Daucus carota subsp. sativus]|uniref:uncharacterized protein LOC135147042 n=1 Tax=Daucus carota subsp. sativus TaxID=79200 RepID=UPI0030836D49
MAYINAIGCSEGLSNSRPPLFDGTNFATWKTRFRIYARSQGVKVWMAIEDGTIIPTKIVDDVTIEKKVSEYTHEKEDRMNIAAKAEMVLTSALAEKEYKRVNNCKSAQEMWNKLVVTYEGTTDIKDSRMDTLIQEYENFKLQDGENIIDMETRFTRIIDELSQLGKNYTQNEKNRRVLKSLPPSWKVKVTTIKEMHNLNDYHIDNLFGNLRAYEEDNVPDIVIPKVEDKKKNMALKSILIDEDENDEDLNEEIQNLDESEIALLTRQLRRVLQSKAQRYGKGFLKSNNQQRVFNSNGRPNYSQNYSPNYKSNFPTNSGYKGKNNQSPNGYNNANTSNNNIYTPPKPKELNPEETQDVCFECKQPGHYKRECPKLSKGRILVAENGWDLSEDEESPEASEEVVNLCLMAIEDASTSTDISTTNQEVSSSSPTLVDIPFLKLSSLNLLNMEKGELIKLLVEVNTRYDYLDQLFLTTWSEKEKLEDIYQTQQKEFSRIKESKIKLEEEMVNLQDSFIKSKDAITKLEIENVALILETEEIKDEKLQLNENIQKLHVDLLNLKIQNESLTQERSTTSYLKDSLETEIAQILEEKEKEFKIETCKIKDEHSNILAQCKDQERIVNAKIDALINDKNDLERTIQRFTKGNEMLDRMVHSKISYNHEGLGYDKNAQRKNNVQPKERIFQKASSSPILKCSYCNKNGHDVQSCKFKNGEFKGKHIWVRKGTKQNPKVEKYVPYKNVSHELRQPRFNYHQKPIPFQYRNTRNNIFPNGQSSRNYHVPSYDLYSQNTMRYPNNRNHVYQYANSHKYDSRDTRYYDNSRYQGRNNAPRNEYATRNVRPTSNPYLYYEVLTPGPSRQKGTYKFN